MTQQEALFKYSLRLGDNALVHSYRLSEWCSNAPILEEDLALTNFALDMIGRAQALLGYAGQVEGKGRNDDMLAYKRGEREFYNNLLVELPNTDFAFSMGRLFLMAAYEYYFYTALMSSSDSTLAGVAAKTIKEIKYHLSHATEWMLRLGDGTQLSHDKLQAAIDELWAYTGELFETDEADAVLAGVVPDQARLKADWYKHVSDVLTRATIAMPQDGYMQSGTRNGVHSEYLGHILSEMQYLQRAYPDATW